METEGTDKWEQIASWFHQLADLPPTEQKEKLADLQADEPEIYKAVLQLLQEEEALHPALLTNAPQSWNKTADEALTGTNIGIYKLISHLGSGGMGSVFLAKRTTKDFDREVALKLIRPGNLQEESIQKFKQERQILAQLTHPSIARLYDGGTTEDGRLYFTMEKVDGMDLITFLHQEQAGLSERINLFLQVAEAIAYAHSRLVLHLDLKPGNILAGEDGKVKVLDFGIAERLDQLSDDPSSPKKAQQYTLAYGAPEQLAGEKPTTRSDIYALGVLLYQLFCDRLPIPYENESAAAYKTKIIQADIPVPSNQQAFPHASINARKLRGDLDAICLKCLTQSADERYSSVDQLISDLKAYQQNRPISLFKTNTAYSVSKFINRNKSWLSVLSIALFSLITLSTYYTLQVRQQRNQAVAEAQKNEQLLGFVTDIFQEADPFYAQGDTLTVYDLLAQAQERLDTNLIQQPGLYAEMIRTIGTLYLGLGEHELADTLVQKGQATIAAHPNLQQTKTEADMLYLWSDVRYNYAAYQEAVEAAKKGLAIAHQLQLPPSYLAPFYQHLGNLELDQFNYPPADSFYRQALIYMESTEQVDLSQRASITHAIGDLNRRMEKHDTAEVFLLEALQIKEDIYQPPHTEIAYTLNNLASLYYDLGQLDTALVYAKESLAQRQIVFGKAHIETVASMGNVSRIFQAMQLLDSSLVIKIEMNAALANIFPGPHPYRLGILAQLGNGYTKLEQGDEGEAIFRQAIQMHTDLCKLQPDDNYDYQGALIYHGLGINLFDQAKPTAALAVLRQAMALNTKLGQPKSTLSAYIAVTLGQTLVQLGQVEEGQKHLLAARKKLALLPEKNRIHLERIAESLQAAEGE